MRVSASVGEMPMEWFCCIQRITYYTTGVQADVSRPLSRLGPTRSAKVLPGNNASS